MATVQVSYRVDEAVKQSLEKLAKEKDVGLSDLVREALDLLAGFDPGFWARVQSLANALNVPAWMVLQNRLIKILAQEAAESEIWGPRFLLLDEFRFTTEGVLTGEHLFDTLRSTATERERWKRLEQLEGGRASGAPFTPDDKTWLQDQLEAGHWKERIETLLKTSDGD